MNQKKVIRQRSALKRLEAYRAKFIEDNKGREAYTSTRTNSQGLLRVINHPARPFDKELARINQEIENIQTKLKKVI